MLLLLISIPFLHAFGYFGLSLPLINGFLTLCYLFFAKRWSLILHFKNIDYLLLAPLIIGFLALDYSNIQL
ncbi:hypothetical protein OAA59_02085, partial [bacterium]|nr:hypothetical protein [bacterium]